MSLPLSREVTAVLDRAEELADIARRTYSTGDVLLAMFEVPNRAANLLADRPVEEGRLRDELNKLDRESAHLVDRVRERSRRLAKGARSEVVNSLHLLAALTRESSGHAYRLLEACGVDIGAMRTAVMSYATSSVSVPERDPAGGESRPASRDNDDNESPSRRVRTMGQKSKRSSIGFHPSLSVGKRSKTDGDEASESTPKDEDTHQSPSAKPPAARRESDAESRSDADDGRLGGPPTYADHPTSNKSRNSVQWEESGVGLDLDAHPGINRGGRPRKRRHPGSEKEDRDGKEARRPEQTGDDREQQSNSTEQNTGGVDEEAEEQRRRAEAREDARKTTKDLAERLFSGDGNVSPVGDRTSSVEEKRVEDDEDPVADPELAAEYELDADEYPNLTDYGRNLTVEAAMGEIDAVIGRDEEVAQIIDILGKRRANNPLLVGEPGVGKTAIVEGLARRLVRRRQEGASIGERTIIELEMSRLLSGTQLRGAFSERLLGIKEEVAKADGDVVVFLDEIHMWMTAGSGGDGGDAAGELKTALARGRFPCIGATTHDECREFVESDPAFERRFQRVTVDEPDEETALRIVEGVRTHYERHHDVSFTPGALAASVTLSVRYIHDRQLPDKAIGVLDLAGSRAARRGQTEIDRQTLATVVADMASIPVERLTGSDGDRFLNMESFLAEDIVGHDEIVETISELLRRNHAGFRGDQPIGSLLFLGPTGVGKTEMVKVLADFLFHDRDAVVQIDMSEYMEAHSVSRLIGSPPGYVGHDQGGQLTETIRQRPYQVVLLDEIEKAHDDVLNLLLQLFDEGRLTDGRGREVDFSNALVVMTSNLGAEVFEEAPELASPTIGFSRRDESGEQPRRDGTRLREQARKVARGHFTPELWNRIDEKLVFLPLSRDEIAEIAELQLADSQKKLREESDIEMDYEPGVVEHLIENGGYDPDLGARPMRQTIQRLVEGEVAREILAGRAREGSRVVVGVEDGGIVVRSG